MRKLSVFLLIVALISTMTVFAQHTPKTNVTKKGIIIEKGMSGLQAGCTPKSAAPRTGDHPKITTCSKDCKKCPKDCKCKKCPKDCKCKKCPKDCKCKKCPKLCKKDKTCKCKKCPKDCKCKKCSKLCKKDKTCPKGCKCKRCAKSLQKLFPKGYKVYKTYIKVDGVTIKVTLKGSKKAIDRILRKEKKLRWQMLRLHQDIARVQHTLAAIYKELGIHCPVLEKIYKKWVKHNRQAIRRQHKKLQQYLKKYRAAKKIIPPTIKKKTPEKKVSLPKATKKKAPEKKAALPKATEKKAPEKKAALPKATEKKAPEKKAAPPKATEKKAPEKKAAPPKATEKKAPEKKAAPPKATEKKAPEKKAAPPKAYREENPTTRR